MKKNKIKIKKWFYESFFKRYLTMVDAEFLNFFTKQIKAGRVSSTDDVAKKRYAEIMEVLNSKKYKKHFYSAVNYKYNDGLPSTQIKPFGNNIRDRISKFIFQIYLRYFNKELYESLHLFEKWKNSIQIIEEYMATTTLDERADEGVVRGVIDIKKAEAQKKLHKIKESRVSKIVAHNLS